MIWKEGFWAPGFWADDFWVGLALGPGEAPEITSITPAVGTTLGGETVLIAGTNFVDGATVSFDGALAVVTFVSDVLLSVVTPAGAEGAVDVVVTNPDAQDDTAVGGFEYVAPAVGVGGTVSGFGRIASYVVNRNSSGYIPQQTRRRRR